MSQADPTYDAVVVCLNDGRGPALAKLLNAPGAFPAVCWVDPDEDEYWQVFGPSPKPATVKRCVPIPAVRAAFVHRGDWGRWETLRPAHAPGMKVFLFSGGDIWDGGRDGVLPILQSVSVSSIDLDATDAVEAYQYATGKRGEMPRMCSREADEILPALSVLCQGYLVTFANPDSGEPDIEDGASRAACKRALDLMGWTAVARDYAGGRSPFRNRLADPATRKTLQTEVSKPAWWDPLGKNISKRAKYEWGTSAAPWESVKGLLDVIEQPASLVALIPPKLVAEAYSALVERFERKGGV